MADKKPEALGQSDAFLKMQECISRVAGVDRPVLITGERGTGKELAASRLHYLSKRWQQPFVTLNCAALNPSVLESELFGHEAGSFTGATRRRAGRFEMAQEGTLFLDEIGNMPMIVQEKILRVIEYGSFERVGGSAPVSIDVRIIAATNADLPDRVKRGTFKADLLDRLSFEVITLPPLRDRREDILPLARHFAAQMTVELDRDTPPDFSEEVIEILTAYQWPGNIRELKNAVERAVYKSESDCIGTITINPFEPFARDPSPRNLPERAAEEGDDQPPDTADQPSAKHAALPPLEGSLPDTIRLLEKRFLEDALEQSRFNQRKAAGLLGITYHQMRGLYRKHFS